MSLVFGQYRVTIQRAEKGRKSTVLIAQKVVGKDEQTLLKRAKRDLNVKDTKAFSWKLVSVELVREI